MNKITKKMVLLLVIFSSFTCLSQNSIESKKTLIKARLQLIEGSKSFNPSEGLATFQQLAQNGNAEAMNGLGLIFSKGIQVPVNEIESTNWFIKAAENGYTQASYNLALLYSDKTSKNYNPDRAIMYYEKAAKSGYKPAWLKWGDIYRIGEIVPQDYKTAMSIYKQGADNGNTTCIYAQGYLYYKGLGCTQDYTKAIELFEKASLKGNGPAMYMLGLCYRNGYGTSINNEKAKFWLKKSAILGVKSSALELSDPEPENASPNQIKTISKPISETDKITEAEVPSIFTKVKHATVNTNISGDYNGSLICYDWSGQNVISNTPLEITFNQDANQLSGVWNEEGFSSTFFAQLKDSAIVFHDSKIERLDRYSKEPSIYSFKEGQFQLFKTNESSFIIGNLKLYNDRTSENEKPMYLILEKKHETNIEDQKNISSVVVYPNPIQSNFNLSFSLAKVSDVNVNIYHMNGQPLYSEHLKKLEAGNHSKNISLNAPSGYYLLHLSYGTEITTKILIKR